MNTLCLKSIIGKQLILLLHLLLCREAGLLNLRHLYTNIGKNKEPAVIQRVCKQVVALIGKLHALVLLIYYKVELICNLVHLLIVVLHIEILCAYENLLHAGLAQELYKRIVPWQTFMRTQEQFAALLRIACSNKPLGFIKYLGNLVALGIVEALHYRLKLRKVLVLPLLHRSRYDKRSSGIIYEHRIHLIHNCIVMLALNKISRLYDHIVPKVVKAKLVVCTISDITPVCLTSLYGIRLVLIYAIYRKTVELIERAHPLRVTLGEVIIYGNNVNALAGKRIKKDRERSHQSLSLSCSHLRYHTLMQNNTANKLHIVVHHIPGNQIAACHPLILPYRILALYGNNILGRGKRPVPIHCLNHNPRILLESAGCRLHNCKCLRKHLHKHLLQHCIYLFGKLVNFRCNLLLLLRRDIHILQLCAEFPLLVTLLLHIIRYSLFNLLRGLSQLIVG